MNKYLTTIRQMLNQLNQTKGTNFVITNFNNCLDSNKFYYNKSYKFVCNENRIIRTGKNYKDLYEKLCEEVIEFNEEGGSENEK